MRLSWCVVGGPIRGEAAVCPCAQLRRFRSAPSPPSHGTGSSAAVGGAPAADPGHWDPVAAHATRWQRIPTPGAAALRETAMRELATEVERDEGDGPASIPPLLPQGWSMVHRPATSHFTLFRTIHEREGVGRPARYRGHSAASRLVHDPTCQDPFLRGARGRSSPEAERSRAREPPSLLRPRRTPIDVCVRCQFRTLDPSMFDGASEICEWFPFDVRVTKRDSDTALMLGLSSVNSVVQLRSLQLLRFSLEGGAAAATREALDAHPLLGWSMAADHERQLRYGGPLATELSKPLQHEAAEYVTRVLGIDAGFVEFINQALYFTEHEEYLRWLAQLSDLGAGAAATTAAAGAPHGEVARPDVTRRIGDPKGNLSR